ncbi:MAG TPA: hypothetical protein PK228_22425 [Saprospiraceae bacterium]|nr:hypothetical protein [Saprospiraceae bacterium]
MQQVVQYHISNGVNCIFEIPTETARQYLPAGIEPVEANHGISLIGITMFDFSGSPVGPYQELVVSLYAVPRLGIMEQHPHAAVYPIVVASSSKEARDHAINLWHLPHFMEDIALEFSTSPDGCSITGKVYCHKDQPIVELTVSQTGIWKPMYQLYQSFQGDDSGAYIGIMDMQGQLSEHEEGTGTVRLHDHRFFEHVDLSTMDTLPFREMWMKAGVESYHRLIANSSLTEGGNGEAAQVFKTI